MTHILDSDRSAPVVPSAGLLTVSKRPPTPNASAAASRGNVERALVFTRGSSKLEQKYCIDILHDYSVVLVI